MNKNSIYTIAEIGQAHEGSFGMLFSYIEALAETGVDAVKFQMHIPEAESSEFEPFRVKFSLEDNSRFDYWKRMSFTLDQWKLIKQKCDDSKVDFLCSPFSNLAVDWLEEIGVAQYKIGSGEVNNLLILEKIVRTGKPIIISSGMSCWKELDKTVSFLRERNAVFSILQCTTAYPTKPEQYGLNIIQELKSKYGVIVGFSDHSASIATSIAAVALGAQIIEFHAVFDRRQFGPDSTSSLTIDEIKELIKYIREIHEALNHPINKDSNDEYIELKSIFEKSLAINKDLDKYHVISFEDLESKKPKGYGISATNFMSVIGKTLNYPMKKWEFLNEEDLK